MSDLSCSKCGAALREQDFNLELGVARCGYCKAWSRIAEPRVNLESEQTRLKREVSRPDKYELNEYHGVLHITWKWFTWASVFLIFFTLFWNGIAFAVFGGFLFGAIEEGGWMFLIALFPLIHVSIGLLLAYYTVATLFNRTTIMVSPHHMLIKHGPIPWRGAELDDTKDIDQLFCQENIHRNKNSTSHTYDVKARLASGKEVKLLSRLENVQEAVFLEQQIERFLGIEDRRIAGEVSL
ncbi:MAG: hypothetical protein CMJ46_05305 [Planctomyces sp.]|nr:hypothetical protein [Planctomyces sp.]